MSAIVSKSDSLNLSRRAMISLGVTGGVAVLFMMTGNGSKLWLSPVLGYGTYAYIKSSDDAGIQQGIDQINTLMGRGNNQQVAQNQAGTTIGNSLLNQIANEVGGGKPNGTPNINNGGPFAPGGANFGMFGDGNWY